MSVGGFSLNPLDATSQVLGLAPPVPVKKSKPKAAAPVASPPPPAAPVAAPVTTPPVAPPVAAETAPVTPPVTTAPKKGPQKTFKPGAAASILTRGLQGQDDDKLGEPFIRRPKLSSRLLGA